MTYAAEGHWENFWKGFPTDYYCTALCLPDCSDDTFLVRILVDMFACVDQALCNTYDTPERRKVPSCGLSLASGIFLQSVQLPTFSI